MNLSITILTSLSALAVIFTIIFEGKLKKSIRQKAPIKVISEIKNVSLFGWVLIVISVCMIIGNGYIAQQNIDDTNDKYTEDTIANSSMIIASNNMNKQLILKGIRDSITISNLKKLTIENGIKSDSIKSSVIDNAVKEFEAQRIAIEKERENIFSHFQFEVKNNLRKILNNYEKNRIMGFADTTGFISTKLSNIYIQKYEAITIQKRRINRLMFTSSSINDVNYYLEQVNDQYEKSAEKKVNIRMFLSNVEISEGMLYSIFDKIYNLKSYKEYEAIVEPSDSKYFFSKSKLKPYIFDL